jgi:hypothetical protein
MIEVPDSEEEAAWSNLAPGATVTVSSARDDASISGLVDRRVMKGEIWRYWNSEPGQTEAPWIQLTFPVPITVRAVRHYNPRFGDEANSTLQVEATTVRLFEDEAGTVEVATENTGALAVEGTDVAFDNVRTRVVRIEIDATSGTFYGLDVASLAEVEVMARGGTPPATPTEETPALVESVVLYPNYPNPFAQLTRVAYRLEKPAQVHIEVFDLTGARVAEVLNATMQPGMHAVSWEAPRLASGVYVLRLTAGQEVRTRKLTLVH